MLRPEPGNTRTADRFRRAGHVVRQLPLFAVRPLDWQVPDPARYDTLLLTSANAVRQAGAGLAALRHLPVVAVGEATAAAARAAGLSVALTGTGDAGGALTAAARAGLRRPLHLAGRERTVLPGVDAVAVYASEVLPVAPGTLALFRRPVALLHSARAARRLADLTVMEAVDRAGWTLAAFSEVVAAAAGQGWGRVLVAAAPRDGCLLAALDGLTGPAPTGISTP